MTLGGAERFKQSRGENEGKEEREVILISNEEGLMNAAWEPSTPTLSVPPQGNSTQEEGKNHKWVRNEQNTLMLS